MKMSRIRFLTAILVVTGILGTKAYADPYRYWVGPISEEQGTWGGSCGVSFVVQQAFCGGSYCDDNWIRCGTPTYKGQNITGNWNGGHIFTNYTSEEYFISQPNRAICPFGYAATDMTATGSRSDNVRLGCIKLNLPTLDPGYFWNIAWMPPFSEETGYSVDGYPWWISGVKCTGSYCDNMYYQSVSITTNP
jgi:hypothetical protein